MGQEVGSRKIDTPVRRSNGELQIIVDAHVHIHDRYKPDEFFDCAFSNITSAAKSLDSASAFAGVLMLTESEKENYFAGFARALGSSPTSSPMGELETWSLVTTNEPCSLLAKNGDKKLALIAGHQVAPAEDLEVLMLGTTEKVEDGLPICDLLDEAERVGAVRVVPWGPGKWFFSRGKLVGDIIRRMEGREFFLGDEGGRPVFWPTPTLFGEAARRGVRVLRGTDPLPFPWEVHRVATFGFWMKATFDWTRPWASIRPLLSDPDVTLQPYGRLERPIRFFRNQYGMQMRKRRRSR